jgi:hypothetical protein
LEYCEGEFPRVKKLDVCSDEPLVTAATVHPKKIAAKSQQLGKQISRTRVLQQIVSRRSDGFAFAFCGILLAFCQHKL